MGFVSNIFKTNMLSWALIPLGVVTAILMAVPTLVVLGLFFLILPGVMLAIIPTFFVYTLGTVLIRSALPVKSEVGANLIAFILTLGLSAMLMAPWRTAERQKFEKATLPDATPVAKLSIDGDILLEWSHRKFSPAEEIECDYLTAALLDTPGVTSVTRSCEQGKATFRRGANNPGELVMPVEPQEILDKFAKLTKDRQFRGFDAQQQADRAIQADWALRIAQGDELRRDVAIENDKIDWTIKYESFREKKQPQVERLEIRDRAGNVVARNSLVRHFVPSPLFYYGFEGGSSANGFAGAKFTYGGSTVSNQPRFYNFDSAVEMLRALNIPFPTPQPDILVQLDRRLHEVLNDPQATKAELLLAPMWLQQFKYNADRDQLKTIGKILLDERITDPADLLRVALSSKADLTPLREGLAKRYFSASDPKSKSWYVTSLVSLADGTFLEPTEDEQIIWSEALGTDAAAPFVERMADQGEAAIPELMALLDKSLEVPWHARWKVLRGIREAFKRLGPDGAVAVPRIMLLIQNTPNSLLNSAGDLKEWLIAMYLMGVDAKELPFRTMQLSPAELASEIKQLEQQVQRYEKSRRPHGN